MEERVARKMEIVDRERGTERESQEIKEGEGVVGGGWWWVGEEDE